jgi:prepilin-type N-terminal cleavage/methylation domain-containing protein
MVQKRCFSLIELTIVIAVLGVIAAIAVPRYTSATQGVKLAALKESLNAMRTAIGLYAVEHNGRLPNRKDNGGLDDEGKHFVERLTERTDIDGKLSSDGEFGPYLRSPDFPTNPFNERNDVRTGGAPAGDDSDGWHYDQNTDRFSADDSLEHAAL